VHVRVGNAFQITPHCLVVCDLYKIYGQMTTKKYMCPRTVLMAVKCRMPGPCVSALELGALEEVEDVEPVQVQHDSDTDLCD